jgi:hypothetical protein
MKLPDDKKQRTQVLVLIGMGVLLVLVGLYFGIGYVRDRKKAIAQKTEELTENIRKANLEIDQMSKDRKVNTETLLRIKDLSERYLLKPRIGNSYVLPATEIVEGQAQKLDLATTEAALRVGELGLSDVGASRGKAALPVRAYTAHVSLLCGYNDAVRLIRAIEDANPLLSVLNVSIVGRAAPHVDTHAVDFDVQWPVWSDQDMPGKLEARIAAQAGEQEKR